jgi:hypothetical protein
LRKSLTIGIGAGVVALAATTAAGVASAATSTNAQTATRSAAAVSMVNKHITRAQAGRIAMAKVPHSRVHEIESDDLHDRAVWKVQLSTPRGRVVVDVDKKTGQATIVRNGRGGGDGQAVTATVIVRQGHNDARDNDAADDRGQDVRDNDAADDRGQNVRDNDAAQDRGQNVRDNDAADDRGQDVRDNDAAQDRGQRHGDQHDHGRDGHGHDGGHDGSGR